MSRTIRALFAVLAVAVLAATLVAFAPGDEPEAKAALGPVQAVTLTAADFHPYDDSTIFTDEGYWLFSAEPQIARISFPAETVVITSVRFRVYDNAADNMCVHLYRARPGDASVDDWGHECTTGTSEQLPQTLSITVFKRVGRFHTAYLWAWFGAYDYNLRLYGATVFYRVVS